MKIFSANFTNALILLLISFSLVSCGGGDNSQALDKYKKIAPYQASSYSSVLKECMTVSNNADSCTMDKLPLIGQVINDPTENDILDRLIVSHQWMGDNFKQALNRMPDDMKLLFRSVTAIVIDEGIRPSFYTTLSGGIYLDPASIWLTNEQKKDILKEEDFRSNFGNELSFKEFNTYTRDGSRAFNTAGTIDNNIERSIDDVVFTLSRLLFHELAHANDFASIQAMQNFNKENSIYQEIKENRDNGNTTSWKLHVQDPLNSATLYSLADVRFRGFNPSQEEKDMSPEYVGALFLNEGAVTHYGYSTYAEDVATLFETGMMKYHFDIDRDQAFVSYPLIEENAACSEYIVGGGSRNRIANLLVTNRMLTVFETIFPDRDYHPLVQNWLGSETPKVPGKDWCENLAPSSLNISQRDKSLRATNASFDLQALTRSPDESLSRRIQ